MRILFLASRLHPDQTSCGLLANKLLYAFADAHQVDVITDDVSYVSKLQVPEGMQLDVATFNKATDRYKKFSDLLFRLSEKNNRLIYFLLKIFALPHYFTGFHFIVLLEIYSWKNRIRKAVAANTYDLVFCYGSGDDFGPHFGYYAARVKIPFVANFHDPYPGHLFPEPYRKPAFSRNIKKQEAMKKVLRQAAYVSSPSRLLSEDIKKYYNVPEEKLMYLPHIDAPTFTKTFTSFDKEIHIDASKFTMLHAGTLLDFRNPEFLLKAYVRFLKSDAEKEERSQMIFVGRIDLRHEKYVRENISNKNLWIFPHRIGYERSKQLLSEASCNILLEAVSEESVFMPGKLTDYIAAGKPVLALTPVVSEVRRLFGNEYPYMCRVDEEEKIYELLNQLWVLWKHKEMTLNRSDLAYLISPGFAVSQLEKVTGKVKAN